MGDLQDSDPDTEAAGRRLLSLAFNTLPADGLAAGELARRVRRRATRRRIRTLVPVGALVAAGAAVALVVSLAAADPTSALAAVTAAAAKTSGQSFRVAATMVQWTSPASDDNGPPVQTTGAYDPGRKLVTETVAGSAVRIIDGHLYFHLGSRWAFLEKRWAHGKPWIEGLVRPQQTPSPDFGVVAGYIASDDEPANPESLLGVLRSNATVTAAGPASGPGWTGSRYTFTESYSQDDTPQKVSGTVDVDRQGRVRHLVMTQQHPIWFTDNEKATAYDRYDATFSGFGLPVSVTVPSASQVYNLGHQYLSVNALGGPVYSLPRP